MQTTTRAPLVIPPTPSPNPASSQTLSSTVTQTTTVTSGVSFNGFANAFDFKTVETDTLGSGLKSSSSASDTFYAYEKNGAATDVVVLGSNVSTSDGVTFATVNGSGNGLIDVLPETKGVILPQNDASETTTETDPDGQVTTRAVNADGSYSETIAYVDGSSAQAVVHGDGSGTYSFPLADSSLPNETFVISAPTPGPSQSPEISVTLTIPLAAPPATSPTPLVESATFPAFYPLPLVMSSHILSDNGPSSLPPGCDVGAGFNATTNQVIAVDTAIDPLFGELDQQTTVSYTEPGIGVACLQLNDVVDQFFDFSGQAGLFPAISEAPLQETTTVETLALGTEQILGTSAVARSPQVRAALAHATIASFRALLARKRLARHALFARALRVKGVR